MYLWTQNLSIGNLYKEITHFKKDYNLIKYKDKEFYLSDRRATNGELRSDNIVNYIQNNPQKTMKDVASDPTNFIDFAFSSKLSLLICTMLALRKVILQRSLVK